MEKVLTVIRNFVTDTNAELKKCTWPTRGELWESSILVIITIAITTLLIFAIDRFYINIFEWLTR
ncbi:preprotein translocase subunit SecE [Lentisphaerota bacterium WC36G]|nr:preprotein translocase subunit SecE [Lentisphaerae bacterium WC36]